MERKLFTIFLALFFLAACQPGSGVSFTITPATGLATATPTPLPSPTSTPIPIPASPSPTPSFTPPPFEAATYQDDAAGYAFDYPRSWTLDETGKIGERGSVVQLTSWAHAPGDLPADTPAGGSRLDVTVYTWDPKNDLTAFVGMRKTAWEASGMSIQSEEAWMVSENHEAVRFLVLAADQKETAFFMLTQLEDRYLVFSGTGDLELIAQIARTVRFHGHFKPTNG